MTDQAPIAKTALDIYDIGQHLWVLENIVPLEPPVRARGYPGIWN